MTAQGEKQTFWRSRDTRGWVRAQVTQGDPSAAEEQGALQPLRAGANTPTKAPLHVRQATVQSGSDTRKLTQWGVPEISEVSCDAD